jgi:sugar lactone lactonase YvrE
MILHQLQSLPVQQRAAKALQAWLFLLTCVLCGNLLISCTTAPAQQSTKATPISSKTPIPPKTSQNTISSTKIVPPTVTPIPTHQIPQKYTQHIVLSGGNRPDDLAFDREGRLLFSNPHNGTVNRLNADGSVTVLLSGISAPEGLVVLSDGTLVIAEQGPNRILTLAPGTLTPKVLRQLPGVASTANCKDGVDGIAFDATTNTLIIPDSPIGAVYRLSLDGKILTLLATGIVRPVGAAVDTQGNIYVADECGNALWKITPDGQKTRMGGFGMPDDVSIDVNGTLLVTDLDPTIHALIRFNPTTGTHTTLASKGYIEPQGMVLDQHGDIFVSDDYANIIVEYTPV